MTEKDNAYDDDKLSMEEYRRVHGKPSPLEKAIARKEGRELPSDKVDDEQKKKPTPEETVRRELKELSQEERDELIKELFED